MGRAFSLLALIALLSGAAGCGEGAVGGKEVSQDSSGAGRESTTSGTSADGVRHFRSVLVGLRGAAESNRRLAEIRRADELAVTQKAVFDAFCDTAWQLAVNDETALLGQKGYIVARISGRARALHDYSYEGIPGAMKELRAVINLGSYDAELNRRYKKACDR